MEAFGLVPLQGVSSSKLMVAAATGEPLEVPAPAWLARDEPLLSLRLLGRLPPRHAPLSKKIPRIREKMG